MCWSFPCIRSMTTPRRSTASWMYTAAWRLPPWQTARRSRRQSQNNQHKNVGSTLRLVLPAVFVVLAFWQGTSLFNVAMHYGWILFLKAEHIKRIPLAITPHICGSRNAVNPTKNILTNCSSFPNPVNKPITTKRKIIPERNLHNIPEKWTMYVANHSSAYITSTGGSKASRSNHFVIIGLLSKSPSLFLHPAGSCSETASTRP